MGQLRKAMVEDLKLRGLSDNTQQTYLRCVSVFARAPYSGAAYVLFGWDQAGALGGRSGAVSTGSGDDTIDYDGRPSCASTEVSERTRCVG